MKKILVVYAVKDEFVPITVEGCDMKYVLTGIGKAKAAMKLTKAIMDEKPDLVLNIGTAGTVNHAIGEIFVCHRFVDRDFQTTKLPGVDYEIDFSSKQIVDGIVGQWFSSNGQLGTCNTGDTFVTELGNIDGDVVDMESFAQAIVCHEFSIPYIAVKYVTDIIGQNSIQHWEDKLTDAREGLRSWFESK